MGPVILPRLRTGSRQVLIKDSTRTDYEPFESGYAQVFLGNGIDDDYENSRTDYVFDHPHDTNLDAPNVALLRTCKQVHSEALRVAWEQCTVRVRAFTSFRAPYSYCTLVPGSKPFYEDERSFEVRRAHEMEDLLGLVRLLRDKPFFKSLRHLELEFTMTAFYEFVGVQSVRGNIGAHGNGQGLYIQDLEQIPLVKSVEFRFMHLREHFDDWQCLGGIPSCHEKLCDGVFLFAHKKMRPTLKSKEVTIGGYVREETLRKWLTIFADEKAGIEHGMTDEIKAFVSDHSGHG